MAPGCADLAGGLRLSAVWRRRSTLLVFPNTIYPEARYMSSVIRRAVYDCHDSLGVGSARLKSLLLLARNCPS